MVPDLRPLISGPLSGESYGGIYVPTLVNTIRIMNQNATSDELNLKGFMVSMSTGFTI